MRKTFLLVLLLLLPACISSHAQAANLYMGGLSANPSTSPSISGTAGYFHQVSETTDTYAITVFDAVPTNVKKLTVTSNVGVGVAQKLLTIDGHKLYGTTSAGVSWTGTSTGWSYTGGLGMPLRVAAAKTGSWYLMPNVRFIKSAVSNGADYQLIPGLLFGWGDK